MFEKLIKKIFYDQEEKLVIAQYPNAPLLIAVFFYLLNYLPYPIFEDISRQGFIIFISIWAYLEIFEGVNYFRKTLGVAVMIYIFTSIVLT